MDYDFGTQQSLEIIFSGIMVGAINQDTSQMSAEEKASFKQFLQSKYDTFQYCQAAFLKEFPNNVFQDSYAFLYEVFKTVKARWFSPAQLDTLVEQNRDLVLDSPYINISQYSQTANGRSMDDEILQGFAADLQEKFNELSNNLVTKEEFQTSVRLFKDYYIKQRSLEIAQSQAMILLPGGMIDRQPNHKKKQLHGVQDAREFYSRETQKLREMEEIGGIRSVVIGPTWLEQETADTEDGDYLASFGLANLDQAIGGLRKGRMYGILGAPKGGKTRFANYLVGRLLQAGANVTVWPLEGQVKEWTAIQTAYIMNSEFGINIPSDVVYEKRYNYAEENGVSATEIRAKVFSAKTILAMGSEEPDLSKRRGKLSFIEGSAYEEDFLDVIEAHYNTENAFDVLVIDQVVNILGRARKSKSERISDAYIKLHDFIQNKIPCCMIGPAQLKQDAIDYLRRNPDETIDVTAGGESAETIRTPDEVIGLMSTKEERAAGLMKLYHVASRHGAAFDDVMVRAELGWVHFYDDAALNQY